MWAQMYKWPRYGLRGWWEDIFEQVLLTSWILRVSLIIYIVIEASQIFLALNSKITIFLIWQYFTRRSVQFSHYGSCTNTTDLSKEQCYKDLDCNQVNWHWWCIIYNFLFKNEYCKVLYPIWSQPFFSVTTFGHFIQHYWQWICEDIRS